MKKTKLVLATLILTMAMSSTAFAVGWTQEGDKWCYLESDRSKATNVWRKSGDDWFYLGGDGYTLDAEKDGQWKQNETGWWFENPDGTYPVSTWKEISGNHYYFDENGYMLSNTVTPDDYVVGGDGAWIQNSTKQGGITLNVKKDAVNEETAQAPLFDFDISDSHIIYTKHKLSKDYDGNNCLVLYYDFTNKESEPQEAWLADYSITVFQNGVECDTAFIWDDRDKSIENYSKDVMQGTTINVARAYELQDLSDVTIQIKEIWNWDNPQTQTVTLKITN